MAPAAKIRQRKEMNWIGSIEELVQKWANDKNTLRTWNSTRKLCGTKRQNHLERIEKECKSLIVHYNVENVLNVEGIWRWNGTLYRLDFLLNLFTFYAYICCSRGNRNNIRTEQERSWNVKRGVFVSCQMLQLLFFDIFFSRMHCHRCSYHRNASFFPLLFDKEVLFIIIKFQSHLLTAQ